MSPQYHVVFDDEFTTVRYMEEGTVPPNWADLVEYSSEHASSQDYNLAETWLNYSNRSPNSSPADNPVVDPFAIVTHDHNQGNRNGMQSRKISTKESVCTTYNDVAKSTADSEGEHSSDQYNSSQSTHDVVHPAGSAHAATLQEGGMGTTSGSKPNTA